MTHFTFSKGPVNNTFLIKYPYMPNKKASENFGQPLKGMGEGRKQKNKGSISYKGGYLEVESLHVDR